MLDKVESSSGKFTDEEIFEQDSNFCNKKSNKRIIKYHLYVQL